MTTNYEQSPLFVDDDHLRIEQPVVLRLGYQLDGVTNLYRRELHIVGEFDQQAIYWSTGQFKYESSWLIQEAAFLYRELGSLKARLSPF